MSSVEYFRARASAYRQLANASKDERVSGDMYEIACMFNHMADDLRARQLIPVQEPTRSHLFYAFMRFVSDSAIGGRMTGNWHGAWFAEDYVHTLAEMPARLRAW
jgi:hypothetical protein